MIKVKKTEVKSFVADNGMDVMIYLKMGDGSGLQEAFVSGSLNGEEIFKDVPLGLLVQAAEIAKKFDKRGKFVCSSHGPYINYGSSYQNPSCQSCSTAAISSLRESVAEEADA